IGNVRPEVIGPLFLFHGLLDVGGRARRVGPSEREKADNRHEPCPLSLCVHPISSRRSVLKMQVTPNSIPRLLPRQGRRGGQARVSPARSRRRRRRGGPSCRTPAPSSPPA